MKADHRILAIVGAVMVVVATGIVFSYQDSIPTLESSDAPSENMEETEAMEDTETSELAEEPMESGSSMEDVAMDENAVVEMSSSGFSPKELTISKGDTVTFLSVDSSGRWPASAFHPTHTAYPGSSILKCGTESDIFDSCGPVAEGEDFTFTFDEAGSWNYHDHKNPSTTGTIVVE